jgi:thiol-disulfide isomerase/thioredoxin
MAVIVVVVAVVASFRSAPSTAASGVRTTSTDWALPSFTEGQTITLAQFRGKPVVVNFFASWCTQCDAELSGFAKLSQELRGQVTFVGVNSLETGDRNYMVQRHHIDWWPLAADQGGRNGSGLHDALGARAGSMPLTAFYDSGGQLVDVALGALDESSLRARVAKLNTAAAPRGSGPLAR